MAPTAAWAGSAQRLSRRSAMLLLSRDDVERLLDVEALIDALAEAMASLSEGRASVPNRVAAVVPERDSLLAAMPAYDPANDALTTKLVSPFPRHLDPQLATPHTHLGARDPA